MASVAKDGRSKRVQFVDPESGRRLGISLGRCSAREAETIAGHVEELISAKIRGRAASPATAAWLTEIGDTLYERLVRVGLVEPRHKAPVVTLGQFTADYIESRRADAKPRTIINLGQTRKELVGHFGEDRALHDITSTGAIEFRAAMLARGLADNTVRRHLGRSRQYFTAAIEKGLLQKNPFRHKQIKVAVRGNPDRRQFIPREMIDRVLAVCEDDTQWQTIIRLGRYGALRTPSETLALRWRDMDWENNLITVHCPKLERLERHATRVIPMFPELRLVLLRAFGESPEGNEYVIHGKLRDGCGNWRTQFERLIRRSGQEPWGCLFQNLRSSREVELSEVFPWFTVCTWMGHTREVAREHYMSVPAEHIARAIAGGEISPSQIRAESVQPVHAEPGRTSQDQGSEDDKTAFCEQRMEGCDTLRTQSIAPYTPKGSRTPVSRMRT
jgi:integrase